MFFTSQHATWLPVHLGNGCHLHRLSWNSRQIFEVAWAKWTQFISRRHNADISEEIWDPGTNSMCWAWPNNYEWTTKGKGNEYETMIRPTRRNGYNQSY